MPADDRPADDRLTPAADDVPDTLSAAVRWLTALLRETGVDTPDLDAKLLVQYATGTGATTVLLEPTRDLNLPARETIARLASRRSRREPVSRIIGRREFFGREFAIGPATLDPRPDTETLIELVLDLVREQGPQDRTVNILDIGTGSGVIALTLLAELGAARALATDIDPAALDIARLNAERLGVSRRCRFAQVRSLEGLSERFDVIVSNPPYIRSAEIPGLEPEVSRYDPLEALDGGADGLDVVRELVAGAPRLAPGGWLALEIGHDQSASVLEMIASAGAAYVQDSALVRNDLAGHRRCVAAKLHY